MEAWRIQGYRRIEDASFSLYVPAPVWIFWVCFSKQHRTVPWSKCRGWKLKKKKNLKEIREKKKFTMSHSASACLVGWKFPRPWVSLREFNLASWASSSKQRLLFSASTGLCLSDTSRQEESGWLTLLQTSQTKKSTCWTPRKGGSLSFVPVSPVGSVRTAPTSYWTLGTKWGMLC